MTGYSDVFDGNGRITATYVYLPRKPVRAGDVLLTKDVYSKDPEAVALSERICNETNSSFSHALICSLPPTFTEAIGDGVSNLSINRCFAFDIKNVRLLRYRDPSVAARAASEAASLLGQPYSIRRALRIKFPNIVIPDHDYGTFCTALICTAFMDAGAPEFSSIDETVVTPAHLEQLQCFTDVTSEVLRQDLTPANAEDMSALDGDRTESPLDQQAQVLGSYLKRVRPEFEKLHLVDSRIELPSSFFDAFLQLITGLNSLGKLERSGELSVDGRESLAIVDLKVERRPDDLASQR